MPDLGDYVYGFMQGKGTLKTKAGSYEGSFENNQMHGHGTFSGADGSRYVGPFEHGERSGRGTLTFADGGKYVGPFVVCWFSLLAAILTEKLLRLQANLQHGEGEYSGPVFTYSGEYRSGLKHGNGLLIYKSGNKYEGQLENDVMHGHGTFTGLVNAQHKALCTHDSHFVASGADGHIYVGQFQDGAIHGQGVYTSKDGSVYEGKVRAKSILPSPFT